MKNSWSTEDEISARFQDSWHEFVASLDPLSREALQTMRARSESEYTLLRQICHLGYIDGWHAGTLHAVETCRELFGQLNAQAQQLAEQRDEALRQLKEIRDTLTD